MEESWLGDWGGAVGWNQGFQDRRRVGKLGRRGKAEGPHTKSLASASCYQL
jgi:hypothetical protein